MKLHATQKLLRWKGRIVCWIETRQMHLASVTQKYSFPATICGLRVLGYAVSDKNHDNSTMPTDTLCPECLFHLEGDLVVDEQREHRWQGKTVLEWSLEHERLVNESKEVELRCRDLSIQLGASQGEALELHRQIVKLKEKKPGFLQKAALYLLRGKG